jgi:hypothetical protein
VVYTLVAKLKEQVSANDTVRTGSMERTFIHHDGHQRKPAAGATTELTS